MSELERDIRELQSCVKQTYDQQNILDEKVRKLARKYGLDEEKSWISIEFLLKQKLAEEVLK